MKSRNQKLVILCGPTAVGKTELSLEIAESFSCEIIGVDSMQVYNHMDIGTAKPTAAERSRVAHHLVDIVDPDDNYTMGSFVRDAREAIRDIASRGKVPLLAGGTGLYFKGLLEGVFEETPDNEDGAPEENSKLVDLRNNLRHELAEKGSAAMHRKLAEIDPQSAERIHQNDSQRIIRGLEIYYSTGTPWSQHLAEQQQHKKIYTTLKIGLTLPRKMLYERIDRRVGMMIDQGLLAEVKKLLVMGFGRELKSMQSIGYRHMMNFLDNTWNWEETLQYLARDTRHYAKRQYTWFNSDPEIIWFDVREKDMILREIENFLA